MARPLDDRFSRPAFRQRGDFADETFGGDVWIKVVGDPFFELVEAYQPFQGCFDVLPTLEIRDYARLLCGFAVDLLPRDRLKAKFSTVLSSVVNTQWI